MFEQTGVGHEVGGADDRHLTVVVGVADKGAAVAACHGHVACCLVAIAKAELHLARAFRLPQVAIRLGVTESGRTAKADLRRKLFTGPRHRRHQQSVAGKRGQPAQHVVVEQIERLRDDEQGVGPCRFFHRGDVAGRDDVHAVLAQDRDQRSSALR